MIEYDDKKPPRGAAKRRVNAMTRAWRVGARRLVALGLALTALAVTACGSGRGSNSTDAKTKANVTYAGSLVDPMEHHMGAAFAQATSYPFEGKGAGRPA
jgi:ABC-type molybdate transport system substrate-binding protein